MKKYEIFCIDSNYIDGTSFNSLISLNDFKRYSSIQKALKNLRITNFETSFDSPELAKNYYSIIYNKIDNEIKNINKGILILKRINPLSKTIYILERYEI